ncbi:hypothetical protein [Geomonas anaerohicana]|uniref:Uncharacterized protein n=1 Tax=Geomonas anaerohicana TaxID=2798583 RepID=A0ABS0YC54_9BACT|nr:hypothetical protein [Geomonas anaerohicana]MBJ6749887.1 hypothetical protein [Geomonas anaerohicana]
MLRGIFKTEVSGNKINIHTAIQNVLLLQDCKALAISNIPKDGGFAVIPLRCLPANKKASYDYLTFRKRLKLPMPLLLLAELEHEGTKTVYLVGNFNYLELLTPNRLKERQRRDCVEIPTFP